MFSSVGDMRFPTHLYIPPCEILKGSKVKVATATVPVFVVSMATSSLEVTGSPRLSNHIAVGMYENCDVFTVTIQLKEYADPARGEPELFTTAEMASGGTIQHYKIIVARLV